MRFRRQQPQAELDPALRQNGRDFFQTEGQKLKILVERELVAGWLDGDVAAAGREGSRRIQDWFELRQVGFEVGLRTSEPDRQLEPANLHPGTQQVLGSCFHSESLGLLRDLSDVDRQPLEPIRQSDLQQLSLATGNA